MTTLDAMSCVFTHLAGSEKIVDRCVQFWESIGGGGGLEPKPDGATSYSSSFLKFFIFSRWDSDICIYVEFIGAFRG